MAAGDGGATGDVGLVCKNRGIRNCRRVSELSYSCETAKVLKAGLCQWAVCFGLAYLYVNVAVRFKNRATHSASSKAYNLQSAGEVSVLNCFQIRESISF